MTWINNITNKINKQNDMCELSIHNGKVILIDSSKVYDKKVGKMLKTNDNKYVSRKVIKNTKNKLYWRHIYSYLNEECIELINQMIYQYKMKNEVLGIENVVYFHNSFQYRLESWLEVNWRKEDIFNCDNRDKRIDFWKKRHIRFNENIRDTNKQSKKLQKSIRNSYDIKWFNMSNYCNGLMNNGEICGCESSETLNIDRDYFNNQINTISFSENSCDYSRSRDSIRRRYMTKLSLCKRHYNKYEKMNDMQYDREVDKIYNKMGYKLQNGYLCKVC